MRNYANFTSPLEKLLKKDAKFIWIEECKLAFDTLKECLVIAPAPIVPYWNQLFHVNLDASSIMLGTVLVQLGEGKINHPITFASRKISLVEHNYTNTKQKGLAMVYALQKFHHYLLGSHFKFFTDNFMLWYLLNELVLGVRIYHWLLLFQEFNFEVVIKLGKQNVGPDHLSKLQSENKGGSLDDALPDSNLFRVEA